MQAYMLNIEHGRRETFRESLSEYGRFAEPVPKFSHGSGAPLLVLVSAEKDMITHIASGRPGGNAGTGLRRLNLEDIHELAAPITHDDLIEFAPKKVRRFVEDRLISGGTIPKATLQAIVDGMIETDPSLGPLLARYSAKRDRAISKLSSKEVSALAKQKEAVRTALHLAGIDRKPLSQWSPTEGANASFLDGLPKAYLREDQMIFHDMQHVPGLDKVKSSIMGTFHDGRIRLDIILANRMRLEEQTGADLIYYNATYESFVLVQYKAMEQKTDDEEAAFRLPDEKLTQEIARMDALMEELGKTKPPKERSGYRLLGNPFFIKICPRIALKPDDAELTPGCTSPSTTGKSLRLIRTSWVPREGGRSLTPTPDVT